jgi:hypothetical protein
VTYRAEGVTADGVDGPLQGLLHGSGLVGRDRHGPEELQKLPFTAKERHRWAALFLSSSGRAATPQGFRAAGLQVRVGMSV